MGLFYRRPLCLFCGVFLLGSIAAWFCPSGVLPWLIGGLAILIVSMLIFHCVCRARSIRFLTFILCVSSLCVSLFYSFVSVDLAQARAWRHLGDREVELVVREVLSESPYASRYTARLVSVDGQSADCRVLLEHGLDSSLAVGDRVYGRAEIARTVTEQTPTLVRNRDGQLLRVSLLEDEALFVRRDSTLSVRELWRNPNGLLILSSRVRSWIDGRLADLLGDEIGSLSIAFLLGDTADLSPSLVRDFRRAGVSHMMAVSGLHISVLLGSVELLLRRLFFSKKLRCVTVAVLAIFFLFLTGFSLSACRSVLMLFSVYLSFFRKRENDTPTALFASIVLILLAIPYSVADLGMWMSFLATLGLVTLYPLFEARLPRSKKLPMRLLKGVLSILCLTVVANLFLLPILGIFFGELSLVALLANLILTPFSYVLLIGTPLLLILAPIPWLGEAVRLAVLYVGRWLCALVEWCSSMPSATLSLRYDFCSVLLPIFAVALFVLLVIRLRRKWILAFLPVITSAVFIACVAVDWWRTPNPMLTYINDGEKNEYICVEEHTSLVVCDLSRGGFSAREAIYDAYLESDATEIGALVLTHCHEGHRSMLASLCERLLVRTVYLPVPVDSDSLALADELALIAHERGSEVVFYESGSILPLTEHSSLRLELLSDKGEHSRFLLSFAGRRDVASYASLSLMPTSECVTESRYLIFGAHGDRLDAFGGLALPTHSKLEKIFYPSASLMPPTGTEPESVPVYVPTEDGTRYSLIVELS